MLKTIFKTATFKQSQITIAGTIINGILGAFFYILMARFLGPSDFGLLTLSVASLTLIADIADFGTNTGLVRFVSSHLSSKKEQALKFLKLAFKIKFAIWLVILILGIILSPFIATIIFRKDELLIPLRLVMVGVGGALLFTFTTSALQSFQKYFIWGIVNVSVNLIRLFFIFFLFFAGGLNLVSGLITFIVLPFFGFFLGLLFLPTRQIFKVKNEFGVSRQFFKFNFWVGIFTIIAAISARLDTFLTARLLSGFDLGIYGSANQLVQVMPQIVGALGVVVAPKFASFTKKEDMIAYLKKFQLLTLGLALLGLLVIPFSSYLIPAIFGAEYSAAVAPFIILIAAMLVFLISTPIHSSIIYYFGQPRVFVWVSLGHLIITAVLGYFMIINFGVIGAASSVFASTTFGFIAPLIWFLNKVRTKK